LIHTPFGVPECEGDFARHENGDIILDLETDHVATWKKMEEMVQLGLTKSIGVSNFNIKQIQRILDNCSIKPVSLQIELHIYLQQKELVEFCKKEDIIVTAYSPLGSKGIGALHKMMGIERTLPDLMENSEILKIAETHKKTPAQILLRWIIERGIAAIPKSTNPTRLKENFNIYDFELSSDEMNKIFTLDSGIRVCDFGFFQGISIGNLVLIAGIMDTSILPNALVATTLTFGAFAFGAMMSKRRSLLFLYSGCLSALSWLMWFGIANWFLRSNTIFNIQLYAGLAVMTCFVAADTQKIIEVADMGHGDAIQDAMNLFVDLVAIFVRILVVLIKNSERNKREEERSRSRRR